MRWSEDDSAVLSLDQGQKARHAMFHRKEQMSFLLGGCDYLNCYVSGYQM